MFVEDGFVEADFIGGPWDGKTYAIPHLYEWRIHVITKMPANRRPEELVKPDVAVYRHVTNGIYWFVRLEKADEN